jgi:hypothetical protein
MADVKMSKHALLHFARLLPNHEGGQPTRHLHTPPDRTFLRDRSCLKKTKQQHHVAVFWGNNPFARSNMDTTSGPLRSKIYMEKLPPVSISIEEIA